MKKTIKKIITVITTFALIFTSLPAISGSVDAHAAGVAAPAQVKNLKATNITHTSVKLTWTKIAKNRNTKGYAIYRNGKLIKRVSFKTNTFTNTKLKAGTKYKFTVRAYNTYKQKQYYNSKTKKWQAKKPTTKQWKGKKTRTVTAYKYGKVSATRNVTTKKVVKKTTTKPATDKKPESDGSKKTNDSSKKSSASSNTTTSKDSTFAGSSFKASTLSGASISTSTIYMDNTHVFYYELKTQKTDIENAIRWTSSDSSVATVERQLWNGTEVKVTCKKAGTATITATNWDGQKKAATIKIENKKPTATNETTTINSTSNSTNKNDSNSNNNSNNTSMKVTSIAFYPCYYGTNYPGEDAKNPTNYVSYEENCNRLTENGYFVLQAYLYPNTGENTTKPVTWTIKENTIGATTEVKGRNLIVKTPKYTRTQFNGKLVIEMSAGGLTLVNEYKPIFPRVDLYYEDLLNYNMTSEMKKVFLWEDFGGRNKEKIRATVNEITAGCKTERQKVGEIIKWFHKNIEYDYNYKNYTLQGTWEDGRGVCAGQAALFAQMLRYADIPAGVYTLRKSYNHAVTVFWMEGEWYSTDATQYCKGDYLLYKYYGTEENWMVPVRKNITLIDNGERKVGSELSGGYLKSHFS